MKVSGSVCYISGCNNPDGIGKSTVHTDRLSGICKDLSFTVSSPNQATLFFWIFFSRVQRFAQWMSPQALLKQTSQAGGGEPCINRQSIHTSHLSTIYAPHSDSLTTFPADLSDWKLYRESFNHCVKTFGRLDACFLNAGCYEPKSYWYNTYIEHK